MPFEPGEDASEYSVQVWGADGTTLYRSRGLELPSQAVLGFSDSRVHGVRLLVRHGQGADEIVALAAELHVQAVYANHDDEPSALAALMRARRPDGKIC